MAVDAIGLNGGANLLGYFAEIMVGSTVAGKAFVRPGGQALRCIAMHAVAGFAFNFAAKKTFAARKQLYLVAVNVHTGCILVGMEQLS